VHAALQHTPSAHTPELQTLEAAQATPAERLGVQIPAWQYSLGAQSPSTAQSPAQLAAPHMNGAQSRFSSGGQVPRPSQSAAIVATPLVQLAVRHDVPDPGYVHEVRTVPSQ